MVKVVARDLPDLWFQAIYNILKNGGEHKIDSGSFAGATRLEYDYFTGHVLKPGSRPLLPEIPVQYNIPNPVSEDYLNEYVSYIMTPEKKDNEQYTYGERLTGEVNQVEEVIKRYKRFGHRNNQMILQIGQPSDIYLEDPPCWRTCDTRIQDNKLHFFIYYRSWDLYSGLPCNLAGIQLLKEYMADEIGVEDGEMIVESKGLHLYDYCIDLAKIRCMAEGR
jgi:thymidylate synthase